MCAQRSTVAAHQVFLASIGRHRVLDRLRAHASTGLSGDDAREAARAPAMEHHGRPMQHVLEDLAAWVEAVPPDWQPVVLGTVGLSGVPGDAAPRTGRQAVSTPAMAPGSSLAEKPRMLPCSVCSRNTGTQRSSSAARRARKPWRGFSQESRVAGATPSSRPNAMAVSASPLPVARPESNGWPDLRIG